MEHLNLLKEYELELLNLKSQNPKDGSTLERIEKLEDKIDVLHRIINEKKNSYLIQTKNGYLTKNNQFTENVNFAYVFNSEEAIEKARSVKGWLVERD